MNRSSPLLLLVATLFLLIIALAAFWISLMPQRMLTRLAEHMSREEGLTLEALHPRLRLDGGLVLQLEAVTLADANSATSLSARDMSLDVGVATLFGGAVAADTLTLNAPVLTLDISRQAKALALPARHILFREGTVKLRDSARMASIGLSDVNGSLTLNEAAKLNVSFMQNGVLTTLVAEAENAQRLLAVGSPADIVLSSRNKIISFSGRAVFNGALALDGQLTFEGQDLGQSLNWIGLPLKQFEKAGAVAITSAFSSDGLSATFKDLSARIGTMDIKGLANLQAGPDRMKLTADLTLPTLALLPVENLLARSWSETAFRLADMTAVDVDLKLKAEQLALRGENWGAADVTLTMNNGNTAMGLSAPNVRLDFTLAPKDNSMELNASIDAKAFETKTLLGGLLGFADLSGLGDLTMKASATGSSPAAMVSTLKGNVSFNSRQATLNAIDLSSLLTVPQEGWKSTADANTVNFAMAFDAQMAEGLATLTKADITLPGIAVKANGETDLLRQAFNLTLTPKGKVQAVKGTWALPLFAADAGIAPPLRPESIPAN